MLNLVKFFGVLLLLMSSAPIFANKETAGQLAYNQCIGCHSFGYSRTGPDHCGVIGRQAGTVKEYDYSIAMSESAIVWDQQTLDEFLTSPLSFIQGTTMGFVGISDPQKRQVLIEYIKEKSSSLECNQ